MVEPEVPATLQELTDDALPEGDVTIAVQHTRGRVVIDTTR